ncbi:non-ribosomal peptide synthetase [Chrysiogenes arsenatis]|uniref:non-ribosomal peptide synthetase n=1 Tax=Chrysiogenes arsenatis TaxID=309797 RepID=UPI0004150D06|nr:non-ribosomal peptide synthetase [Chrysiogenes arsenatis]
MHSAQEQKYRDTLAKASTKIQELMGQLATMQGSGKIAIVGVACRFPGGADSPEQFWSLLCDGFDAVGTVPDDRWDGDAWWSADPSCAGKSSTKRGAFLRDVRTFDAAAFNMTPMEADFLDPQQRLLLELSCEALERSGIAPASLRGSRTGVYVGMSSMDYAHSSIFSADPSTISPFSLTGILPSVAAGRLSYFFDITGPSLAIDTACSSSLVALLTACRALSNRECDGAFSGGVNLMLSPVTSVALSRMNALSPDGFCRAFGENANGYVRGEGGGIVYLKRLEDAEREGLPILAVICGGAANHDGKSNGLTAPNAISQQDVIEQALKTANLTPLDIGYVETHGTGTPLGDPIEARALATVFQNHPALCIGSVKSNIGHLEAAAGIASLIKALLIVREGNIPRSLHTDSLNQHIPWKTIPIRVATENRPFPADRHVRTVGVSSFGFSGTNAHVIVQEYSRAGGKKFPLSVATPRALQRRDHWLPLAFSTSQPPVTTQVVASHEVPDIVRSLVHMVNVVSGRNISEHDVDSNLFELGLDSLMLIQLRDTVNRDYGVTLELSHLMEQANTLRKVAQFAADHSMPRAKVAQPTKQQEPTTTSPIEAFFEQQLDEIRSLMQQQLATIQHGGGSIVPTSHQKMNIRALRLQDETPSLTNEQRDCIAQLLARHNQRTARSKALAQQHRPHLADWINTLAYRYVLKEIAYPIASASSCGSRFTDVDDNTYIDLAMGFGVAFFGHAPQFITDAIGQRMARGMELATQLPEAGEAAELFCRLTGMERVTFCNTGSEAVMMALRIARTVTKRERVVIFAGAYHGTNDGILAFADDSGAVFPVTPGITYGAISSLTVLPYGTDDSLAILRAQAHELAAILVEPVQSRRPGFRPVEFLKELRTIADASGAALIFDEMITGFRTHAGGAQAVLGVRADIATYGKAIGGGMPISMVAGSARFLDAVDGGFWQFGDTSQPEAEVTFFGGTFCRHPLALAASLAVMRHLEEHGPALQAQVNARMQRLATALNQFFVAEEVPMLVQYFGSLFRFESYGQYAQLLQPLEVDLFFAFLKERGIYTWERRICFLSTAHNDDDIDQIIVAVQESIAALRRGGFPFRGAPPEPPTPFVNGDLQSASTTAPSVFPVSAAQKRLYILSQYEEGEGPYHLTGATAVHGALDTERLRKVFAALMQRHAALRTSFTMIDGDLVQQVHESVSLDCTVQQSSEAEASAAITHFIRPFDLAFAPLLRVLVLAIAPERHIIVIDSHHIALDGFSMTILVRELVALYGEQPLSNAPQPFHAAVAAEQRYLHSTHCGEDERFWREKLAGELPVIDLPCDFARPVRQSFRGDAVHFRFTPEQTSNLKRFAATQSTTLSMVLLSGWVALLHRLSTQDDILLGTSVAGREGHEFHATVGMFASTLPLRFHVDAMQPFHKFLQQITRECFACFEHQRYPFDRLVETLGVRPDPSRNPLFDVSFVYEKADERAITLPGLTTTPWDIPQTTAMFDITLEVIEEQGMLRAKLEYATALFHRATIERWQEYYTRLLTSVCTAPTVPVGRIDFLPPQEREHLQQGGFTSAPELLSSATVLDLLEIAMEKDPHAPALLYPVGDDLYGATEAISYREFGMHVDAIAQLLVQHYGIRRGDRVGLLAGRSSELVLVLYAIIRCGAAYVPMDVGFPSERIEQCRLDSHWQLLVTDRAEVCDGRTVLLATLCAEAQPFRGTALRTRPNGSDAAYVIYTSGSTGQPKGCEITHRNLLNYVAWGAATYLPDGSCGCFAFATPLSFDLTVTTLFLPLVVGKPIVIYPESVSIDEALEHALDPRTPVDSLKITPSHVSLIEHLPLSRTNVALAVVGGEQFTREQMLRLESLNPAMRIINEYGPTETTVGCIIAEVHSRDERVSIGVPIANTGAYVLDGNRELVPYGVKGELCIAGVGVGNGYLNRPELTAQKFIAHPFQPDERMYCTGDLALRRPDGQFECFGRRDGQVKIRGYRIELGEIETTLLALDGVKEATVLVRDIQGAQEIVAFVTGEPEACGTARDSLLLRLPAYMVPFVVVRLDAFPLTTNGKIDRNALVKHHLPQTAITEKSAAKHISAPILSEAGTRIAAVWSDVLGMENIDPEENFFALGGQSLKAMAVIGRLQKEYGFDIKLRDFFASPTISALSAVVESRRQQKLVPITRHDSHALTPLSHGQKRFWLLDQTANGSAAYNMSGAWLLVGALKSEALKQAFFAVSNRHEALRTSFVLHAGQPRQCVAQQVEIPIREVDMRDAVNAEAEAKKLVRQDGVTPFNLTQSPLMRVLLIKLPADTSGIPRTVVCVTLHHIIADGWSVGILMQEISQLYAGENPAARVPLPITYRDYVLWHNAFIASESGQSARAYWMEALTGDIEPLHLPTDFPRPERLSDAGASVPCCMGDELSQRIRHLAATRQVTLFTVLLAAITTLLHVRSGQQDIIVGTPVSGREHPDLVRCVGLFLNTLALRNTVVPELSFEQLLANVKSTVEKGFSHQEYPFDMMVEALGVQPEAGRNPLFDVLFVLQNTEPVELSLPSLRVTPFTEGALASKCDLMFDFVDDDVLSGTLEYSADLYRPETVIDYGDSLKRVLEIVTAHPAVCVGEIERLLVVPAESISTKNLKNEAIAEISEEF